MSAATLLLVDDFTMGLNCRGDFFKAHGYRVLTASNGEDALLLLDAETPDLAILDFRMPNMDGGELARRIRGRNSRMPIIMLSGYPITRGANFWPYVNAYLRKGSPAPELLKAVERLIEYAMRGKKRPEKTDSGHLSKVRQVLEASKLVIQNCNLQIERNYQRVAEARRVLEQARADK